MEVEQLSHTFMRIKIWLFIWISIVRLQAATGFLADPPPCGQCGAESTDSFYHVERIIATA